MEEFKVHFQFSLLEMTAFFVGLGFEVVKPDDKYLLKVYKKYYRGFYKPENLAAEKATFLYWVKDKRGNLVGPVGVLFPKIIKCGILTSLNLFMQGVKFDDKDYFDKPPKRKKIKNTKKIKK